MARTVVVSCVATALVALGGCSPAAPRAPVELEYFGYAAVACDLDDPFDADQTTDYSSEVASFTNANQVCVTADPTALADRLRSTAALYTPVFAVEPIFFEFSGDRGRLHPGVTELWLLAVGALTASGVAADDVIFYLADEPGLRGLPYSELAAAATLIRSEYPDARIMVIEAYLGPEAPKIVPDIDVWGFNAYALPDPGAEPLYTDHLDWYAAQLEPHQSLVLVMDATYTPHHREAGLVPNDMAAIAQRYADLAHRRTDVSMMLAYAWAGGIDSAEERGVRDLPASVREAHEAIGRTIVHR